MDFDSAQTMSGVSRASGRAAQGQLSLNFDIPKDGIRHDFVRTGGNVSLTLNVSDRESTTTGLGVIWAVACGLMMMFLLRALELSAGSFVFRLLVLTTAGSLGGLIFLPQTPARSLCATVCVAGLILASATIIVRSFVKRRHGVTGGV